MQTPQLPQRISDFDSARFVGPGTPPPGYDEGPEGESVLKVVLDFLGLLRRNVLLVIVAVTISLGLAAWQMQRAQPQYRATAVVRLVDKSRQLSGGLGDDPARRLAGPMTDPVQTQIQVLQSRGVAAEVVAREGLQLVSRTRDFTLAGIRDVEIASNAAEGVLSLAFSSRGVTVRASDATVSAAYGAPITVHGLRFVVERRPQVSGAELEVIPVDKAVSALQENLRGRPRDRTDIIDISYVGADPVTAQRVANTAAAVFQLRNAQMEKQQSVRRREFIEQQLQKVETQLSEAQLAHNSFRSREQVYSSQKKFETQQTDLSGIDLRREELNADRQTYASLLTAIQSGRTGATANERLTALVSSPGVMNNPVVSQLYTQLVQYQAARESLTVGQWASSGSNPDVKRLDALVASTESKVLAAVRGQLSSLDARLAALDDLRKRTAGEMSVLPTTEAEESQLLAQVETYRQEADRLREELQKAQIEEAAEAGQIDIVDLAALPRIAVGTGRAPKLVLAVLLGVVLGCAVAYMLENYRAVIRLREDIQLVTATPNLALVPRHRIADVPAPRKLAGSAARRGKTIMPLAGGDGLITLSDGRSTGAEAYRTLRTNLLFSGAVNGLRRVLITSAGPQEGKSTTSANLAVAFAQQGHRVLLIDCDLRRPRVHKLFVQPSSPGLTDVLLGRVTTMEAIRPTRIDTLMVLPAGTIPPNPAELLGSGQMGRLLESLADACDIVILDTPPVLAASDAAILSRLVDGVVVVVRAGMTERGALQEAFQQMAAVNARVLGTVLNDPDSEVEKFRRYQGYYYNNYYGYAPNDA